MYFFLSFFSVDRDDCSDMTFATLWAQGYTRFRWACIPFSEIGYLVGTVCLLMGISIDQFLYFLLVCTTKWKSLHKHLPWWQRLVYATFRLVVQAWIEYRKEDGRNSPQISHPGDEEGMDGWFGHLARIELGMPGPSEPITVAPTSRGFGGRLRIGRDQVEPQQPPAMEMVAVAPPAAPPATQGPRPIGVEVGIRINFEVPPPQNLFAALWRWLTGGSSRQ